MLIDFFLHLRSAKLPVSVKEYLMLLEAVSKGVIGQSIDDFYHLSRASLVKDERNFDKFDRAFGAYFKGVQSIPGIELDLPLDWLQRQFQREFTAEEKAAIEAMGGLDKLMERLRELLEEQKGRHEGGSKWIGTGGTSPFGHGGYNPEGVRIGGPGKQGRAVKVWEKREYRNLDDSVELGVRNIKVALRRLRRFARQGADEELDMDGTIDATARHGYLDVQLRPERRNTVKVLLLLDVGGSMDGHIKVAEELFSAARSEFKHLEHFYFHNCLYEGVWKDNRRRHTEKTATWDLLHRFPRDWRVVFVGDATMSPYEVTMPGGSVEHWNEEAGAVWLKRVTETWDRIAWINPTPEKYWSYTPSIQMINEVLGHRMHPMTLSGLEAAMRDLAR